MAGVQRLPILERVFCRGRSGRRCRFQGAERANTGRSDRQDGWKEGESEPVPCDAAPDLPLGSLELESDGSQIVQTGEPASRAKALQLLGLWGLLVRLESPTVGLAMAAIGLTPVSEQQRLSRFQNAQCIRLH